MEYYYVHLPQQDLSNLQYGPITKQLDDYLVNETSVVNNRAIHGDIVYLKDNYVVGIKERNHQCITGILHLNTNKKYGMTKRIVPYYKFTSIIIITAPP